ncbi:MAG: class I fructose-bisphosphate aldolase [Usitatibacter sp.]
MDTKLLTQTAKAMVAPGKGLLAADESSGTCKKRFDSVAVECNEENRRAYREMLFTTPKIGDFVSGVILFDETLRQKTKDGAGFAEYLQKNGIIPGIKVDAGAQDMALHPGEKVTEGLDGLAKRMDEYFKMGARFAKWRAVITIGKDIPSYACLRANAHALTRYSAICQQAGIVPIVEPEVLLDGDHSAERSEAVHEATLEALFHELQTYGVSLEHVILKASMVVSGKENPRQAPVAEVAERTLRVLKRTVPAALPGVVFLSGGKTDVNATAHLDAMNRMGAAPWPLTFSYSRALQAVALKAWRGQASNVAAAQKALQHRARMNSLAARGQWKAESEKEAVAA